MVIGRTSQRTERLRRVLSEDRREGASAGRATANGPSSRASGRSSRRYTAAAQRDQQIPICDAIPQRRWAVLVWCLLSTTVVAGHAALEAFCQWAQSRHVRIDLSPLQLRLPNGGGASSLSTYSLCLTLLLSTVYAALILNFRRHRIDDYRGRYRLWYYVCGGLFGMGMLIGSGLIRTLNSSATELAEVSRLSPHENWLTPALCLMGTAGLFRLMVEMRAARGAMALLLGAGMLAVGYAMLDAPWLGAYGDEFRQWLRAITRLTAAQLLLLSMVVYSRHVYIDAQGLTVQRAEPRRRGLLGFSFKRKASGDVAALRDSEASTTELTLRTPPQSDESNQECEADDDDDESGEDQPATVKLSRAERRRQGKEKRRQPRAA